MKPEGKIKFIKLSKTNCHINERWALDFLFGFKQKYRIYQLINSYDVVFIKRDRYDQRNIIAKIVKNLTKQNFNDHAKELEEFNNLLGGDNELWIITRMKEIDNNQSSIRIINLHPLTEEQRWVKNILGYARMPQIYETV